MWWRTRVKYLVTGGAGFVGSHLCELLLEQGHSVVVIDDLSTGRIENVAHLEKTGRLRIVVDSVAKRAARRGRGQGVRPHLPPRGGRRRPAHPRTADPHDRDQHPGNRGRAPPREPPPSPRPDHVDLRGLRQERAGPVPRGRRRDPRPDEPGSAGRTPHRRWSTSSSRSHTGTEKRLPVVIVRLFNTVGARQTGRYGMVIPRLVSQALSAERRSRSTATASSRAASGR